MEIPEERRQGGASPFQLDLNPLSDPAIGANLLPEPPTPVNTARAALIKHHVSAQSILPQSIPQSISQSILPQSILPQALPQSASGPEFLLNPSSPPLTPTASSHSDSSESSPLPSLHRPSPSIQKPSPPPLPPPPPINSSQSCAFLDLKKKAQILSEEGKGLQQTTSSSFPSTNKLQSQKAASFASASGVINSSTPPPQKPAPSLPASSKLAPSLPAPSKPAPALISELAKNLSEPSEGGSSKRRSRLSALVIKKKDKTEDKVERKERSSTLSNEKPLKKNFSNVEPPLQHARDSNSEDKGPRPKRSKSLTLATFGGVRKLGVREVAEKLAKEPDREPQPAKKDKEKRKSFWSKKKKDKEEEEEKIKTTLEQVEVISDNLIAYFCDKIQTCEGLFRISGPAEKVSELKEELLGGNYSTIPQHTEHTCASVLKTIYRESNELLIPFAQYDRMLEWHDAQQKLGEKAFTDFSGLKTILLSLDATRLRILTNMTKFLAEVAKYSEVNMMTPANLGIVFSPNVIQTPADADVFRQFEDASKTKFLMQLLIENQPCFFGD